MIGKQKFLIACLCPVLVAGCGMQSKAEDDILDVELPLKTTHIAPYESDASVKMGATETLFKVTDNGTIQPHLVKHYQQVTPHTLKLTLKSHIYFQNGVRLTGEKVKHSLEQALAKGDLLKSTLPVKHISSDGQSLTITTSEPYPQLISELASPFSAIYDTEATENVAQHPIGTGPYEIASYTPSKGMTLKPNRHYWNGKPKLKGIRVTYQEDGLTRVNHLEAGATDVITDVPATNVDRLKTNKALRVQHVSGYRTQMVLYNQESAKMTYSVRQAIDKVINRDGIVKAISHGYATPANGPFNSHLDFISHKESPKQNIEAARHIMARAGYSDTHPLDINVITYDGRPELSKIAQVLQSDARKAYIHIHLRRVDDIESFLSHKQQWDASLYSIGTYPRGDTGYFFNQAYLKQGGINKGGYHDGEIATLIHQLNHTVQHRERNQLSNEIIQKSQRAVPNSYISYNDTIHALSAHVHHLKTTPNDIVLIDEKVAIDHDK